MIYAGCIYFKPPIATRDKGQLTRKELANKIAANEFDNLNLCLNHTDEPIGKIIEAYQDEDDGSVYVRFIIDENSPAGKHAAENVGTLFPGLSLSHDSFTRELKEISLCGKGYRENTVILPDGQIYLNTSKDSERVYCSPQYLVAMGKDITVQCSLFVKNRYVIANAPSSFDQLLGMEEVKVPEEKSEKEKEKKEKAPETDEQKLLEQAINQLTTSEDPASKVLLVQLNKLVDDNTKFKKYDQRAKEDAEKRLDKAVSGISDPKVKELIIKTLLADQAVVDSLLNEPTPPPPSSQPPPPSSQPPPPPQPSSSEKKTKPIANKTVTDNLLMRISNLERANMQKRKTPDSEEHLIQASDETYPKSNKQDLIRMYYGDRLADNPFITEVAKEKIDQLFHVLGQVNCSQTMQGTSIPFEDIEHNIIAAANKKFVVVINDNGKRSFD